MSVVGFDEKSLKLNGKLVFIYSGEIHYFRVPRGLWEDRLIKMRRAFLNSAAVYFAWNWHEQKEGCFDFSGWRDVDEFLRLCEKHGLHVIARPGPYICSEWDFGGLPNWLMGRNIVPRSLDKEFIKYALRYYDHIIPIIRRHLATRGGSVVLFQIENEYFWGNVPYLLKLYEATRERGIDVPIVHNVDRFLRGTQVIDSIDIYPDPWDVQGPLSQADSLAEEQPDKPRMVMEFEGGWFTSFGGKLPTDRGDIPAEWTDMLLKTMVFKGFSLINFYMFHGGTNFGYWTGKNVASTYDYQAAVREWGELGDRYWTIRLLGGLLESFNDLFASSSVDDELATCSNKEVHVASRTGEKGSFILVANRSLEQVDSTIFLREFGEKRVKINGRNALILPFNLKLANGWVLEFSTCQVFYSYDLNGRTLLILYGDPDSRHEATLIHPFSGKRETLSFRIHEDDFFRLVEDGSSSLLVIALSRQRAAGTWFAEHLGKRIAIISGFNLLRSYSSENGSLRINVDFKKGDGRLVRMIVPRKPRMVEVNGVRVESIYNDENWVLSFILPDIEFEENIVDIESDWRYMVEDLKLIKMGEWVELEKLVPPESLGMIKNGHMWYVNSFRFEKQGKDKIVLFIPRVNDYVSVFLNGEFMGYAKHVARFEVDEKLLKNGENELMLLIESTGHRNDGILPIGNGLNEPVFVGREETIPLKDPCFKVLKDDLFLKPGVPAALDYSQLVNRPLEVLPPECFSEGWRELKSLDELAGQRGIFLFKYVAKIPETSGKPCVVLPSSLSGWGRIMLFVNGKHAGTFPVDEGGAGTDVTRLVKQGEENELIFLMENMPSAPSWSDPCIRLYDNVLDKSWRISQGLLGEKEGWFNPGFDDSSWNPSVLTDASSKGRVLWLRRRFTYRSKDDVMSPLMLRLGSMGTKCKIYLNGELIGRYMKAGPQDRFYMPEPFLRKDNLLAIAVENYEDSSEAPFIQILPYYFAKKTGLKVNF